MQNVIGFVAELNRQFEATGKPNRPVFNVKPGPVYDKVTSGGSVFCFVTKAGEVLKAASWKAPAKGVRFLLADITPEFIAEKIVAHGYATTGWLYR
jgi:hypothetical protein